MCDEDWEDVFPRATNTFFPESISDYCPCIVKLDSTVVPKP